MFYHVYRIPSDRDIVWCGLYRGDDGREAIAQCLEELPNLKPHAQFMFASKTLVEVAACFQCGCAHSPKAKCSK